MGVYKSDKQIVYGNNWFKTKYNVLIHGTMTYIFKKNLTVNIKPPIGFKEYDQQVEHIGLNIAHHTGPLNDEITGLEINSRVIS